MINWGDRLTSLLAGPYSFIVFCARVFGLVKIVTQLTFIVSRETTCKAQEKR